MYKTLDEINKRVDGAIEFTQRNNHVRGRTLTHDERVLIGTLADGSTQKETGELLGVSQTTVSSISRGLAGGYNLDKRLRDEVNDTVKHTREAVVETAISRLMESLGVVGETLPNVTKATDASMVARNMAGIVSSLEGKDKGGNFVGIKVIIESTNQKTEKEYDVIDV